MRKRRGQKPRLLSPESPFAGADFLKAEKAQVKTGPHTSQPGSLHGPPGGCQILVPPLLGSAGPFKDFFSQRNHPLWGGVPHRRGKISKLLPKGGVKNRSIVFQRGGKKLNACLQMGGLNLTPKGGGFSFEAFPEGGE